MIHPVRHPDPLIYEEMEKFDFDNPPTDPIQLAHDLAETMLSENGMGIAANQMGLPYRVFAIKSDPIIVCFNPRVVDSSEETVYLEEGCLSFPNLFIKIKRPATVKVRYTEPNGNVVTTTFGGLTARVFQHELDHLDGIAFQRQASALELQRAKQKKKKLDRKRKNG